MGVFGDTLRQARAQKGVTLKEAEQATRINRHHLSALEEENFAVLPPLIYQRGIVRNYAAYLDLEPGKLLASFEEARGGNAPTEVVAAVRPLEMPNHWAPNFAIIAFMVVMSAIIFAWIYSAVFSRAATDPTAVPPIPTVTPPPTVAIAETLPLPERPNAATIASPTAESPSLPQIAPDTSPTPRVVNSPPAQPTATPSPTATATPPPTVTPVPPTPAPQPTQAAVVEQQPAEQAPAAPAGTVTIRVIAQSDVEVTVADADGQVYFSGWLPAGQATDWFTASLFQVTTSNGAATLFENQANLGFQFYMGYGANETYFLGPQ